MDANQFAQLLEIFNRSQQQLLQQIVNSQTSSNPNHRPVPVTAALLPPFENFDAKKISNYIVNALKIT